jgi:hypothetical protein
LPSRAKTAKANTASLPSSSTTEPIVATGMPIAMVTRAPAPTALASRLTA